MILIKIHRAGRSVNDQNALFPCEIHQGRYFVRQRVDTLAGGIAPVTVPHVAQDQGGFRNRQCVFKRYTLPFAAASEGLYTTPNGKVRIPTARCPGKDTKATQELK